MGYYRISRNVEASLVDFIVDTLPDGNWTGINVLKGFPQEYKGKIPFIGVEVLQINPIRLEIGSKTNIKYFTVKIRIFAKDDGQRLDLADWLSDELEDDVDYYTYSVTNGIATATPAGRIVITKWNSNEKELQNTNPEFLEKEDRYRHLFSFVCIVQ